MGILEEINSLVKIAAAMPPQNPVVPGIGAPPPAGKIAPPEVKTPALPVPPQHKSELPEAVADRKVDWLKDLMAKEEMAKERLDEARFINPYKILAQRLRRSPVDRLKGSYR